MCKRLFLFLLLFKTTLAFSTEGWKLSVVKDDIRIYTRPVANSKIKAIRVECSLPVKPKQLVATILDIDNSNQWVYKSKMSRIIKKVSPAELYYYAQVNVPWPAEDRDYIAHIMVSQNPKTKVITIDAPCITGMVPIKPHMVRISHSIGKWTIEPYQNNAIRVSYELEVDPAGSVPAWLVNLFATQGPMETFERLKLHLQNYRCDDSNLNFLID